MNIVLPKSWNELTSRKFLDVCRILSDHAAADEDPLLAVTIYLAGIRVMHREGDGFRVYIDSRKNSFILDPRDLAKISFSAEWVNEPPTEPCRPSKIGGAKALHADLEGMKFGDWLAVDTLWQAYIFDQEDVESLRMIAESLYPGIRSKTLAPHELLAVALWVGSLKRHLQRLFPNFYVSTRDASGDAQPDARKTVYAQIRALTKGDITKSNAVLETEMYDALSELDELASEYNEQKSSTN